MINLLKRKFPRNLALACAALAGVGAMTLPQPAQARVFFSFGVGVPVYYGPHVYRPYYYPYYVPGPVYYAPPPTGVSCDAGPYVCPLHYPRPVNSGCSCPAEGGGRIGGYVR